MERLEQIRVQKVEIKLVGEQWSRIKRAYLDTCKEVLEKSKEEVRERISVETWTKNRQEENWQERREYMYCQNEEMEPDEEYRIESIRKQTR